MVTAPARATRALLAVLLLLLLLDGCDDDSDNPPDDAASGAVTLPAERAGRSVWVLGHAIRPEANVGFLVKRTPAGWELGYLDLPFASVFLHALAAPTEGWAWIAGEGATEGAAEAMPFIYRAHADGLVEVPPPRASLAVTRICPVGGEAAWAVGAVREGDTLSGYAGYWNGTTWEDRTPPSPAGAARWNLSNADLPTADEGAALGLVSGNPDGAGILGAVFLYRGGGWLQVPVPFDPETDVFIFTDIRHAPADVMVIGRANLAGWIGHLDPASFEWTAEDLSVLAGLSPMWEINAVADDGAGTRYAFGSQDVAGFARPLLLRDAGDGWTMMDVPPGGTLPDPAHVQLRDGAFLGPGAGYARMSEYYYGGAGGNRDADELIAFDGMAWTIVPLAIPEARYQFRALAAVGVE